MPGSRLDAFEALAEDTSLPKGSVSQTSSDVDAVDAAQVKSLERTDGSRVLLTRILSWLYLVSVSVTLVVLAFHIPQVSPGAQALDPYAAAMVDILKAVVLPVVTFMLGFYFGIGRLDAKAGNLPGRQPKPR